MFNFNNSFWLTPGEQEEVIDRLVNARLIKWDNGRKLPLKSGGFTDVYINLRETRSHPETTCFLADLYANPLHRLRVERFAEVPDAVSPIAGVISANTRIPLVTIREETKPGRVTKGRVIGDLHPSERMAVIDDVITDGKSKIQPLITLQSAAVNTLGIVVLVDRQQRWHKKLAEAGFGDVGVWPAMTLHDVRKFLIKNRFMQRCDKAVEEKNPLIVALDGKSWEEILPVIDQLRTTGCILKVNDLLFDQGIANLLPNLSVYGRVMADLKGHDIPNTVGNICKRLWSCPPWAVTIHASGGGKMIAAAKKELADTPTKILAVTVLTSLDQKTCEEIYVRQPLAQVLNLSDIASAAGADGFVCSPQEAKPLKERHLNKLIVTPGIRSPGKNAHDQERIATPKGAMDEGASHLVMGRQILEAPDPVAEVMRVINDELGIAL